MSHRNYNNVSSNYIDGAVLVNGNFLSRGETAVGIQDNNTKSFVKGSKSETVSSQSGFVTDPNYIDFKKLYTNVLKESQDLAHESSVNINSPKIEINKPGNYTIQNTSVHWCDENNFSYYENSNYCSRNRILIKNYDPNSLYIFNMYNEILYYLPFIDIMENGSSNSMSLINYIDSGRYKGNIIFNLPNAKYIYIGDISGVYAIHYNETDNGFVGNIIAPKADIDLYTNRFSGMDNIYYSDIICNSLTDYRVFIKITKSNYNFNNKLITSNKSNYIESAVDYSDDYYSRDYSISDLLQNYNIVTLNHKSVDSRSPLCQEADGLGCNPGDVSLFHITGQALISGSSTAIYDLQSNEVTETFIKLSSNTLIQPWDNMDSDTTAYIYQKNSLLKGSHMGHGPGIVSAFATDYINFDRLYNNIVAEQSGIDEGTKVNSSDGVAHIPIGGNYVIDDINDINKIVFDNFEDNKKMITVVTIKNSGDINFPEINRDKGEYKGIVTNDYYGKEKATHLYEADTFINEDSYYGNIIWNLPNATYVTLKGNAPFVGHMIAPNADVETPETHFAGCFIVNSIYGEGNTEAHFYPLTAYDNCECSVEDQVPEHLQMRFNELRLNRLLGGEKSVVETTVLGDQEQYRKDTEQLNGIIDNCPLKRNDSSIVQILTNPKTYSTIGIVLGIIVILGFGIKIIKKKKNIN